MGLFIDGLAILYMLFNGILGYSRGIVDEFGRLIGLVLSIIIATGYTIDASKLISEKIVNNLICNIWKLHTSILK